MNPLEPLEALYDVDWGNDIALPPELARLYGRIGFPPREDRPYVVANFVTTLDGVVSLDIPGQSGGGPISGFNPEDRMIMGMLRAVADAVVVGAGTLRSVPEHVWTPEYAYPDLSSPNRDLRGSLAKQGPPLNVIVTARGEINTVVHVFRSGVPVLIVTNEEGANRLRRAPLPSSVTLAQATGRLSPQSVLAAVNRARIERTYGEFCRVITLPGEVVADKISAEYKEGVLKIVIPKTEKAKFRHVEVKG